MGELNKKKLRSGDRIIIEENLDHQEVECHLNRYRFAARYVKDKVVLDLGCGTGSGTKILKDAGAKLILGIDISEESIKYANKKYRNTGCLFSYGDILNAAELQDCLKRETGRTGFEKADAVVCLEAIEHMTDPLLLLQNIYRILKPEGIAILSTPNKLIEEKVIVHENEFTLTELKSLMQKAGFEYCLFGQRCFPGNLLNQVILKAKADVRCHQRSHGGWVGKVKTLPVIEFFYFLSLKFRARLMPLKPTGVLSTLDDTVGAIPPGYIPYTIVAKCLKAHLADE